MSLRAWALGLGDNPGGFRKKGYERRGSPVFSLLHTVSSLKTPAVFLIRVSVVPAAAPNSDLF